MNEGSPRVRTAESDGITVSKTVIPEPDGATVALEAASDRAEPSVVRLSDPALDSLPAERVEFRGDRPDRGSGTTRSTFERELGSGESWTTAYRVSGAVPDRIDAGPSVSISDRDGVEALLDRSRSDRLRGFVSGERETLSADRTASDSDPPATPSTADASTDHFAQSLLAELRDGTVDRETKAELRAELTPGRSHDVRLKHLQQEVGDLAAYTELFEAFVDEYGPPDERAAELDGAIEGIRAEQADIDARLGALESEFERVDDRLDRLETFREGLSGALLGSDDE